MNRIRQIISFFLLGLYLFGAFTTGILHPLYHCHDFHLHQPLENNKAVSLPDGNKSVIDLTQKDFPVSCILCHFGISYELVIVKHDNKTHVNAFDILRDEDIQSEYYYIFHSCISSRAPPVQRG